MKRLFVILFPLFFVACNLIDDNLSVCGEELVIDYQLQLRTELSTQLQTELSEETDSVVREALRGWLSPVFTDKAKDIDLHFFNKETDELRHRILDVINASQTSYTLKLPKENYTHLALANIADNNQMSLADRDHSATMCLSLPTSSALKSMNTGVFSARMDMTVDDSSKQFNVYLYMVNAAVALVIDTTACDSLVSLSGTLNNIACGFSMRDSAYRFDRACAFELENVPISRAAGAPAAQGRAKAADVPATTACLATVGMPSRDDEPWTLTVKATLIGNRYTTSKLTMNESLGAGELRIIRIRMNEDGSLMPVQHTEASVSITLDWQDGGSHEINL